jgi:hypothetical protein
MATLQATKVSSQTEQMPGIGDGQSSKVMASSYAFTAAPASGDVLQSGLIQAGSVITDVTVVHTGLGAAGAFEVGYGGDTDYFVVAGAQTTAAVVRMSAGTAQPLVLSINDTVDVRFTGTGATATGTVTIIVTFLPRNT